MAELATPGEPSALLVVEDATEVLRSQRLLAWAEMARMIAHEIKNPLTPIQLTAEHLLLVLIATGAAIAIGVPVGILLTRRPSLERPVLAVANVLQTIPSLALFGFLIPLLGRYGIGRLPAVIALFLYSLLPIIRNTFAGIRGVDRGVHEAALGMGLTSWQILTNVELPLSTAIIIAGILWLGHLCRDRDNARLAPADWDYIFAPG